MAYLENRIHKLQQLLQKMGLDGLIVTEGYNLRYLTGFKGGTGDGLLVVGLHEARLITDARYQTEYQDQLPEDVSLVITREYYAEAVKTVAEFGIKQLAFEASLSYEIYNYIEELLPADISLDALPGAIESLREAKDEQEITAIKKATQASVKAFNELLNFIKVGQTERQVADELDRLQKKFGGSKPSFDTIVASGYRSALPHGEATDKVIEAGDLVTIDFGYYVDGYTSDVTRTIAMGQIDPELEKIYNIVKEANAEAIDVVKPGIATAEVDRVARQYIEERGYGQYYNHGTGHGAGLNIHEGPVLTVNAGDEVLAGNLLTIEPGIYLPERGGVRIEDDILVTPQGHENLTEGISKELIIIDR
ncbi:M24 family metallopeptidase [Convivina praedatoris]|uniref:M24 family metallopeptidase n=1 Tax=Convivina praedatoris TaxID=2880963 RepID=UPI00200F0E96|nr:aminopeptidase P family protein [Convivina sp. LMG 32447]CAH1853582.1 Aminopeptidase YpdF [Convivina sp. LMG 32447]